MTIAAAAVCEHTSLLLGAEGQHQHRQHRHQQQHEEVHPPQQEQPAPGTQDERSSSPSPSSSNSDDFVPTTTIEHIKRILSLALPNAATFYSIFSLSFIAVAMLGGAGEKESAPQAVSAFGLCVMCMNFIGLSSVTGLVMALDTLLPQSIGSSRRINVGASVAQFIQASVGIVALWVCVLCVIFVTAPLWLPHILRTDDPEVARLAAEGVRYAALLLPFYLAEEVLQCYLSALNNVTEIFAGAVAAALTNPLLLFLFLHTVVGTTIFGSGADPSSYVDSAVIALVLSELCMVIVTFCIAHFWSRAFDATWTIPWTQLCASVSSKGAIFLSHAFGTLGAMFAEWGLFELTSLAASVILPHKQFTAQVILQQLATALFPLVLGVCLSVGILIGIDVGAGRPETAKACAWTGLVLIFCEFIVDITVVFAARGPIARLLSPDDAEVVAHVEHTLPLVVITHITDSLFCLVGYCLRAHGLQRQNVFISLFGYLGVGLPLAICLALYAFPVEDRMFGLWVGSACGQLTSTVIGAWYIWRMPSWDQTEDMRRDVEHTPA